jgi:hypothetical protein
MQNSRRTLGLAAVIALILAVTLPPSGEGARTAAITSCLVCGTRGMADAILNVVLFVPFGIAAAATLRSGPRAVAGGALFSALIEIAQLGISGRDPSLGDLLFNTLGALGGVMVFQAAPRWIRPGRAAAERLSLSAAAVVVALFVLTGWLLQPDLPESMYFGQWTPELGHLETYDGTVLEAAVGDVRVPAASSWPGPLLREALSGGAPISVRATAGGQPPALASIFSIYDLERREVVLLGADRGDLVFRYRTRAARLRLDQPDVRASGAQRRLRPGEEFRAAASRAAPRLHLRLDGHDLGELGFTLGSGWGVLLYPEALPPWLKGLARIGWVALLMLPVGYWQRRGAWSALAAGMVPAALLVVPHLFGLLPTPPAELIGATVGWGVGAWLARLAWTMGSGNPPGAERRAAPRRLAGTHIA